MSRKEAERRFNEGDIDAIRAYAEKRSVKEAHQKFRTIYHIIHPSDKSPTLNNRLTYALVRKLMREKFADQERPDA